MEAFGAKFDPIPPPRGARKPDTLARLPGRLWLGAKDDRPDTPLALLDGLRGGAAISPLVGEGGCCDVSDGRLGLDRGIEGVSFALSDSDSAPLTVLPVVRFRLRTVTDDGM